ncbi:MAG: hypothetical protein RLZZ437_2220 [Pseudomonadota bacterium]|jgi:hypothetical protein
MSFTGSCHCGALHYDCDIDPVRVTTCNCSICIRKGSVLHFVDAGDVRLTADPAALGVYRFHRHIIAHHFCKVCGVAPWSEVTPPSGARKIALNLRASGVDFAGLPVSEFDGAAM